MFCCCLWCVALSEVEQWVKELTTAALVVLLHNSFVSKNSWGKTKDRAQVRAQYNQYQSVKKYLDRPRYQSLRWDRDIPSYHYTEFERLEGCINLCHVSTKQSGSVQFSLLHIRTVIFAFPLSKVVDGTKTTAPYRPLFLLPLCWGT